MAGGLPTRIWTAAFNDSLRPARAGPARSESRSKMSEKMLGKWLKAKLSGHGAKGIPISEIPVMWELETGSLFSLHQFGFSKRQGLCSALKTFSDIVFVAENEHKILTAYPAEKDEAVAQPHYDHLSMVGGKNNDVRRWLHQKVLSTNNQGLLASTIPDLWKSDRSTCGKESYF